MTPKQVALVQDSFAKVAPISEAAAVLFYDRLFDVAPQMKAMFPDDMIEQRRKLMAMLAGVVKGLGNLEQVLPAASALAKRHVNYGAKAEQYPVVDAGEGSGGWLDAGSGGCVGHRLWHAVRLHDFRSIWSQSGCRVKDIRLSSSAYEVLRRRPGTRARAGMVSSSLI
jgi:hypothetical protein